MLRMLFALLILLAPDNAGAAPVKGGTVTAVDASGRTFSCHWQGYDWTFRVTPKTTFRIGYKSVALTDIKAGAKVDVSFHQSGNERIADAVSIISNGSG
jgi:hypothetical protein